MARQPALATACICSKYSDFKSTLAGWCFAYNYACQIRCATRKCVSPEHVQYVCSYPAAIALGANTCSAAVIGW